MQFSIPGHWWIFKPSLAAAITIVFVVNSKSLRSALLYLYTIAFHKVGIFVLSIYFVNKTRPQVFIYTIALFLVLIISLLTGGIASKDSWQTIILNFRLPKAITAIMVGSGLSICGLLMQTLFRNPLAGPFVLGISSGASLGVALLILGSSLFGGIFVSIAFSNWALAIAASLGSFFVLFAVIIAANKVRNTMSILIIGLMFGSLTSAVISVLSVF